MHCHCHWGEITFSVKGPLGPSTCRSPHPPFLLTYSSSAPSSAANEINVGRHCIKEERNFQQRQCQSNPELISVKHCESGWLWIGQYQGPVYIEQLGQRKTGTCQQKVDMAICVGCFVFCTTSLSIEFPPLHIWLIAHHDISVLVRQCSEAPNILINPQSFFSRRIWNWNKRSNICCGIPSNVCVYQYKSKLVNLWNTSNIIWEGTCALRQRQGQTNAIRWSTWNALPTVSNIFVPRWSGILF